LSERIWISARDRVFPVSDQVTLEVRNALLTLEPSPQQVAVTEKGLELMLKELTLRGIDLPRAWGNQ